MADDEAPAPDFKPAIFLFDLPPPPIIPMGEFHRIINKCRWGKGGREAAVWAVTELEPALESPYWSYEGVIKDDLSQWWHVFRHAERGS